MRVALSFEEILDRSLQGSVTPVSPAGRAAARVTTATAFGFFQLGGCPDAAAVVGRSRPTDHSALCDASRIAPPSGSGPVRETVRSTSRCASRRSRLTPEEHVALGDLRRLGAELAGDFTRAELRSAFRALARRYHPDRHPQAPESIKAELSVLFRRLRAAYSILSRA